MVYMVMVSPPQSTHAPVVASGHACMDMCIDRCIDMYMDM